MKKSTHKSAIINGPIKLLGFFDIFKKTRIVKTVKVEFNPMGHIDNPDNYYIIPKK